MYHALVALSCVLGLTAGSALAQQQGSTPRNAGSSEAPGGSFSDKAKQAAQTIGDKAKEAATKVKDMAQDTTQKSKATDSKPAGAADGGASTKSQQMQRRADAEFKLAKTRCGAHEQPAQRTLCEKQAAAAHANAELRIAKSNAAAQDGKGSGSGAEKSSR